MVAGIASSMAQCTLIAWRIIIILAFYTVKCILIIQSLLSYSITRRQKHIMEFEAIATHKHMHTHTQRIVWLYISSMAVFGMHIWRKRGTESDLKLKSDPRHVVDCVVSSWISIDIAMKFIYICIHWHINKCFVLFTVAMLCLARICCAGVVFCKEGLFLKFIAKDYFKYNENVDIFCCFCTSALCALLFSPYSTQKRRFQKTSSGHKICLIILRI